MIKNKEYVYSDARNVITTFMGNTSNESEHKKLKKLFKGLGFNQVFIALRATIISYSHKLSNIKGTVQGYSKFELSLLCKLKDMYMQLEKNIATNGKDFDIDILDVLKGDYDE